MAGYASSLPDKIFEQRQMIIYGSYHQESEEQRISMKSGTMVHVFVASHAQGGPSLE